MTTPDDITPDPDLPELPDTDERDDGSDEPGAAWDDESAAQADHDDVTESLPVPDNADDLVDVPDTT